MKRIFALVSALALCATATAQKTATLDVGADEVVVRWNNATAPHSSGETLDEEVSKAGGVAHTSETVFYIFKAERAAADGRAVVILPGGGYSRVNVGNCSLAKWFKRHGITAVVVKYRLPNGHPIVPLEDAQEALRYTREHAAEWNVDPAKVGVLGSSAGGHLAAYVSTFTPDGEKPDFAILYYPVISGTFNTTQTGTFKYLLEPDGIGSAALRNEYSLDNHVSATTPPTLLLCCHDDPGTTSLNSIKYYKALKYHGVRASLHIYPQGGHGWVGKEKLPCAVDARKQILDWLSKLDPTQPVK